MLIDIQVPIDMFMWFTGGCIFLIFALFRWLLSYVISQHEKKNKEIESRISFAENKTSTVSTECENRHHRTRDHITNEVKEVISKMENNHAEFGDLVRNTRDSFVELVKELSDKTTLLSERIVRIETRQNLDK